MYFLIGFIVGFISAIFCGLWVVHTTQYEQNRKRNKGDNRG